MANANNNFCNFHTKVIIHYFFGISSCKQYFFYISLYKNTQNKLKILLIDQINIKMKNEHFFTRFLKPIKITLIHF